MFLYNQCRSFESCDSYYANLSLNIVPGWKTTVWDVYVVMGSIHHTTAAQVTMGVLPYAQVFLHTYISALLTIWSLTVFLRLLNINSIVFVQKISPAQ